MRPRLASLLARRTALVLALVAPIVTPALGAQETADAPALRVELPPLARLGEEGPLVRATGILADPALAELVRGGFPARLRYRVELWAEGRVVDELQRAVTWDVLVRARGRDGRYEVVQRIADRPLSLGDFPRLEDAATAVARPVRVPILPPASARRLYYVAVLDVEALSVSDLDEVNRWLRGDLQPSVRGERNPGTALTRGVRALAARLLGGSRRRYEARSPSFRASSRTTVSP